MKRSDTLTSDDSARDAWTSSESRTGVPPGVPAVLSTKAAAAALGIDRRLMMGWISKGFVPGAVQFVDRGKYWVPTDAVQHLAKKFMLKPDWDAAIDAGP